MKFLARMSGQAGVENTVAANIAYIFSKYGYRVVVFDADTGLANQDILFNIKADYTILDVFKGEIAFEEYLVEVDENLFLIPGESGEARLNYSNRELLDLFYQGIERFDDFDYLVIDIGAGIGESAQSFIKSDTNVIIVTILEPYAIMDTYAMIEYASKIKERLTLLVNSVKNKKEVYKVFSNLKIVAQKHLENPLMLNYVMVYRKKSDYRRVSKRENSLYPRFCNRICYSSAFACDLGAF